MDALGTGMLLVAASLHFHSSVISAVHINCIYLSSATAQCPPELGLLVSAISSHHVNWSQELHTYQADYNNTFAVLVAISPTLEIRTLVTTRWKPMIGFITGPQLTGDRVTTCISECNFCFCFVAFYTSEKIKGSLVSIYCTIFHFWIQQFWY